MYVLEKVNPKQKFIIDDKVKIIDGPKHLVNKTGKVVNVLRHHFFNDKSRCFYRVIVSDNKNRTNKKARIIHYFYSYQLEKA